MVCSAQGLAEHNHEVDEVAEVRALIHEVTGVWMEPNYVDYGSGAT